MSSRDASTIKINRTMTPNHKVAFACLFLLMLTVGAAQSPQTKQIEQWGIFESELKGPVDGNPFVDSQLAADFSVAGQPPVHVNGFYDGDGVYRIRFMPDKQGQWEFVTASNRKELDGQHGRLTAVAPSKN